MTIYESVLAIAKTYMGPAADSFVTRQCQVALQTTPTQLTSADCKPLAHAIEVAACRFIERTQAEAMAGKIAKL